VTGRFPEVSGRQAIVEVMAHKGDAGYKTGLTPTLAGDPGDHPPMKVDAGSSDTVVLQDNPPGYSGPAGPGRDAAWQAYLAQQSGAKSGTVSPTLVLPNPDAVSDPGLKTVGAAAKQQGVSYAWGGGHIEGKTGVSHGQLNTTMDESWTYNDHQRIGFDCAGLARFATCEGRGIDISAGNNGDTDGQYGALSGPGGGGRPVSDAMLKPGDLIYYGPAGAPHHVAIYAGNGLVVQAHGSGTPVEVSPIDLTEQHVNVHIGN
jgi:NlpC/P60 family